MPSNGHVARSYRLIDSDSHVNEPPDLWQSRVPAAYRDRAPRMEHFEQGDAWVLEGVAAPITFGLNACAGLPPGQMQQWMRWEDIRRGGWDPAARLAEMDTDGVDAQILYPTPRLSHSIIANQDTEFHLALVRAYNDWLADYCSHAPHRLGGLVMVPNRGIDTTVAEFERAIRLPGMVGALVTCYPHGDLDIEPSDDALWRAVAESGYPLHIHVSMINEMPGAHTAKVIGAVRFWDAPTRILQLVQTGVFDRIPALQVVVTETDCGWVPYLKEQADDRFHRMERGAHTVERLPSDYIADHFSFTYITDHYGIRNRHDIGVERILWSSDYPHVGADWPNSWRTIGADFSGIERAERDLILAGNAERLYHFSSKVPALQAVGATSCEHVLLEVLVTTSAAVAAAPARSAKTAALADLLSRLPPDEIEAAVAWLSGEPRQGKVGVGWATVFSVDVGHAAVPSLTIDDLDRSIEDVSRSAGPGSVAVRQAGLAELLGRATHEEAEFVRRLLTGELRQGALAGVMTDAVAQASGLPLAAVRRAAMLTGDLPRIARLALTEGQAGLDTVGLTVLHPVSPMLASPSAGVVEAIEALGLSSVEWKLDGARIQAHRLGSEVRLFTRNGNDVTSRLPSVASVVAGLDVEAVVLDGEVLGAGDGDRPERFQDTMSRFSRQRPAEPGASPLGVWFFDCLHLNGRDLIDEPLADRAAALDRVAAAWRVPAIVTDDPEAAALFLAGALAAGHEGVVVKAVGSRYEAGRRGQAWRKVKPVRTFDLVVLAAEWGHGRRRGWLSNLHLGARDPAGGWVMVGKTFKGLTDALLTWQTEALLARQTGVDRIVVFVRPELVVEVAIDGVQKSSRYPGGVALRFARVRRYRDDKTPEEADTIDALRALLAEGTGATSP